MKKNLKKSLSGVTLIEMMIALLLGSILSVTVGAIIIYSNEAWKRSVDVTNMVSDVRYVKRDMEFKIRGATTDAFAPAADPTTLQFATKDPGDKNKFYINQYQYDSTNKNIVYTCWDAARTAIPGTNPQEYRVTVPFVPLGMISQKIVMSDVSNANFVKSSNLAIVSVDQQKSVQSGTAVSVLDYSNNFNIEKRNK